MNHNMEPESQLNQYEISDLDASLGLENSQSSAIVSIRDRIAQVQDKELDLHVGEYDAIHNQLERALSAIDGL